jgi:outer membrane protein assembly factor BamB
MRSSRTALLCVCLLSGGVLAADWPAWRGADRTDHSADKNLLAEWPKGGPKLVSTFGDAGIGYSGFSVVGDRLYSMGGDGKDDFVFALDLPANKKAWATPVGKHYENRFGGGPRATPTVDGESIYTMGASGDLVCVRAKSGEKVWSINLETDLGGKLKQYAMKWGYSESPLVDGDRVVVTPGGPKGTVAALDKKTGKVVWRSDALTDDADYTSLMPATIHGVPQYVCLTGASVAGVRASDGRLLWRFGRDAKIVVSTPIVSGDLVYVSSSYNVGCDLLKIEKSGNGFVAKSLYDAQTRKVMLNHHGGVILHEGHVYGYSDPRGWTCQELKTGKAVWSSKKLDKGSLTYADGHFVCFGEKSGECALIEATTKGWVEKGRFALPRTSGLARPAARKSANFWTHPVVANGSLYLRDQELIFRYDVRGK